jgi:dGTPase
MYDEHSRARFVAEPGKASGVPRGEFERDRARVLHSAALRRLAAKTQVVGVGQSDFPRTRLTHSLECAQIGRELAAVLGADPDLVDTGCLAHDLGHPPFGHNGETALDEFAAGCGGFEGNAQSLRVLTRLEAKVLRTDSPGDVSAGLNLTRAALDAATKYPWPRRDSLVKFGVYDDDAEVFAWLRDGAPGEQRCLEAQVMDWADDVAYSVHDLEDGVVAGRIDLVALSDASRRSELWATVRDWYLPDASDDDLDEVLDTLTSATSWPVAPYDGSRGAQATLKNLTSELIGGFCAAVEAATRGTYGEGPLTRYAADVVVPEQTVLAIAALKGVAAHFVMRADDRVATLERQREIITQLVAALRASGQADLEPAFRADFAAAADDAARLRVIVDQVASLTDASATAWHRRLG